VKKHKSGENKHLAATVAWCVSANNEPNTLAVSEARERERETHTHTHEIPFTEIE
jgi:hypothetical protein